MRRPAIAVADHIGDRIGAVEVQVRRIGDRAIGIDHNRAVRRTCGRNSQRVRIGIGVVREHRDDNRCVFIGRGRVVHCRRSRIGHGIGKGRGDAAALAVARGHGDAIQPAVRLRRIFIDRAADHACGIDAQTSGQTRGGKAQRIAVKIGEVTRRRDRDHGAVRIILCGQWCRYCRRVVDRRDCHRDRRGRCPAIAVADHIRNRIGAVEVQVRCVSHRAVRIDDNRTVGGACGYNSQRIAVGITVVGQDGDRDCKIFTGRRRVIYGDRTGVRHCPRKGRADRAALAIACGDDNAINTAARLTGVFVDRAADDARRADREACRKTRGRKGQRIAVNIAEIRCDRDRNNRAIDIILDRQRRHDRRIVDRRDSHGNSRNRCPALTVADDIGDGISAIEVQRGRIGDRAVAIDDDGAICGIRRNDGQRIAVRIAVVGQDRNDDRDIFVCRRSVIDRDRTGIGHSIGEQLVDRAASTIADCHSDGIDAAAHLARRAIDCPADQARHRVDAQARRQARRGIAQRIPIDIAEQATKRDRNPALCVGAGLTGQSRTDGCIVDRIDRDRRCCRRKSAKAIADRIGYNRCPVEIGRRHKSQRAVRVDRNRAIGRDSTRNDDRRCRIAIGIGVVGQHVERDRHIFIRHIAIVGRQRWRIGDGPVERRRHAPAVAIGHRDGDGIDAIAKRTACRCRCRNRARRNTRCRIENQSRWKPDDAVGQRIAIDVRKCRCQIDRHNLAVRVIERRQANRYRRIVHRRYRHCDNRV